MSEPFVIWVQRQFESRTTLPLCEVQPLLVHVWYVRDGCVSDCSVPTCWACTPAKRESAVRAVSENMLEIAVAELMEKSC